MKILFPDLVFQDELRFERAVAGDDVEFEQHHAKRVQDIPDASWRAADALLCYHEIGIDERAATLLERCKIIVRAGVGFDQIDLQAMGARGIPVCNTPDYGTTDVADMALAMLLAFARGVAAFDYAMHADPVAQWNYKLAPTTRRLRGQTFGVIGLGRIGTAAALRAQAFGMNVAFFDPYRPTGTELSFNFRRTKTLQDLLSLSDVVSVHCPLSDETHHLINAVTVGQMKRGALLINTARGPICDLNAIHDGIKSGQLAGAGLDVLPQEPPEKSWPLIQAWQAREPWIEHRLLLAPHAAWYSPLSFEDIRTKSMETLMLYLREGKLRDCVNEKFLRKRPD